MNTIIMAGCFGIGRPTSLFKVCFALLQGRESPSACAQEFGTVAGPLPLIPRGTSIFLTGTGQADFREHIICHTLIKRNSQKTSSLRIDCCGPWPDSVSLLFAT